MATSCGFIRQEVQDVHRTSTTVFGGLIASGIVFKIIDIAVELLTNGTVRFLIVSSPLFLFPLAISGMVAGVTLFLLESTMAPQLLPRMNEIHLETIDSTNTYAKQHVSEFPLKQITCVTADEQTAGRGRYQRKWLSPPAVNIYATFYFRLPINALHLVSLAQVMAYSFAAVLLHEGLHPKIKWPNDIQLGGKKAAGVLCETVFHQDFVDLFLGIGINVNLDGNAASQIDQPATSLLIETGQKWDRKALLKKLQKQFAADLEKFKKSGFTPFHSQVENLLAYKGQTVKCFDGKKTWTGICHSLTNDGQLNLYLPDKTMQTILSGDIKL